MRNLSFFYKMAMFVVLFSAGVVQAQTKKSSYAAQESIRKQELQASAKTWFEQSYLPKVTSVLNPIESYSVIVTEPNNVLPPDLGGPLNYIEIVVEARISGWNYTRYNSHGSFSRFPDYGWAQCLLKQKLWAHINSQGRPTKLMKGQHSSSLVACGSSGFFPPEYHGIQRPRF